MAPKRFLPALLLALASVLAAPFLGLLRDALLEAFPRGFIYLLATAFGAGFLALLFRSWQIIRARGGRSYSGLLLVVGLVSLQVFVFNRGNLRVDMVEKVHLLQYGLLALLLYRAVRRTEDLTLIAVPLLGALATGSLEEWVQWRAPLRVGEVMDVLLNVYAGLCGLIVGFSLDPPKRFRFSLAPRYRNAVAGLATFSLLSFGMFFQSAHLGYLLEDAEIGRFPSWHTAEELLKTSARRADSWRREPPQLDRVFGKEDRFVTEAGWHVAARNAAYQREDAYTAWRENQILERYYAPFLDLPRKGQPSTRRLPREVTLDLEKKAGLHHPPYQSSALAARVEIRIDKTQLWAVLAGLIAAIWACSALWPRGGVVESKAEGAGRRPGKEGNGSSGGT